MTLTGGVALQAIFLHCSQKGMSVLHRFSSGELCLLVWGGECVRTENKEASRETAGKEADFTNARSFHSDPDLGL